MQCQLPRLYTHDTAVTPLARIWSPCCVHLCISSTPNIWHIVGTRQIYLWDIIHYSTGSVKKWFLWWFHFWKFYLFFKHILHKIFICASLNIGAGYIVFCVLYVNVHFFHPFFFLLFRLNNFNYPIFRLAASFFCLLKSAVKPSTRRILSPASTSGCGFCVFMGYIPLSPFSGHSHFFWALLSGPAHPAAPPSHHRLPPGSYLLLPKATPPADTDTSSFPAGWYSVERWERRPHFLMLHLLEVYKVGHLMSPYLRVFGGMAFAVFTFFDFPSLPTHSHKICTQIKVWKHLCNIMLGFSANSMLSQCPFIKSPFL